MYGHGIGVGMGMGMVTKKNLGKEQTATGASQKIRGEIC